MVNDGIQGRAYHTSLPHWIISEYVILKSSDDKASYFKSGVELLNAHVFLPFLQEEGRAAQGGKFQICPPPQAIPWYLKMIIE